VSSHLSSPGHHCTLTNGMTPRECILSGMVVCHGWYEQHGLVPILPCCLSVPGCWASFCIEVVLLGFWSPWHQIVTSFPQLITESGSAQMLSLGSVPVRKSEAVSLDIPFKITDLRTSVYQHHFPLSFISICTSHM
jgi:hypothetical protein